MLNNLEFCVRLYFQRTATRVSGIQRVLHILCIVTLPLTLQKWSLFLYSLESVWTLWLLWAIEWSESDVWLLKIGHKKPKHYIFSLGFVECSLLGNSLLERILHSMRSLSHMERPSVGTLIDNPIWVLRW